MLKLIRKKVEMKPVVLAYVFETELDMLNAEVMIRRIVNDKFTKEIKSEFSSEFRNWLWWTSVSYKDYVKLCKEMGKKGIRYKTLDQWLCEKNH